MRADTNKMVWCTWIEVVPNPNEHTGNLCGLLKFSHLLSLSAQSLYFHFIYSLWAVFRVGVVRQKVKI